MRSHHLMVLLFAAPLVAQNRAVIPEQYYRTFSHTNPVFQRIKPGEVVVTKTLDSGGQNERNEQVSPGSNPLTGPFYIVGAEAGDALLVKLRRVRLNRNWGYSAYRLGLFSLTADYVETIYSRVCPPCCAAPSYCSPWSSAQPPETGRWRSRSTTFPEAVMGDRGRLLPSVL